MGALSRRRLSGSGSHHGFQKYSDVCILIVDSYRLLKWLESGCIHDPSGREIQPWDAHRCSPMAAVWVLAPDNSFVCMTNLGLTIIHLAISQ